MVIAIAAFCLFVCASKKYVSVHRFCMTETAREREKKSLYVEEEWNRGQRTN